MSLQLSFTFERGTDAKSIAATLRQHAGLLEGMTPKDAASRSNTDGEEEVVPNVSKVTVTKTKKKAKPVEETFDLDDGASDESADADTDEFGEEEEEVKESYPSQEEVQKACQAHVKKHGDREKTYAIIRKFAKSASLKDVKEEDRAKLIKLLGGK